MVHETEARTTSGWLMLAVEIVIFAVALGLIFVLDSMGDRLTPAGGVLLGLDIALWVVWSLLLPGFFIVEPNNSKVLLLFGDYRGTVKASGFHWVNPFTTKRSVSLRARTLNGEKLKVNDLAGNPVEIAAVVVWYVSDTYKAVFEVENYELYVATQSETAVRHLASTYPYDAEDEHLSLRRNTTEVSEALQEELQQRLARAGVTVVEARLSHLAYAPEIAGVMLRRQQADAIIAARKRIVDGAVGMVEMALQRLEEEQRLALDEERKAAMITNLMVVLCSEQAAQPVLNAGTLYH